MKAQPVIHARLEFGDEAFAQVAIWQVPLPLAGSAHSYKYRLAYVVNGECVLRYDNEAGKGDHKHLGAVEVGYVFTDTDTLMNDFLADIARWNDENGPV